MSELHPQKPFTRVLYSLFLKQKMKPIFTSLNIIYQLFSATHMYDLKINLQIIHSWM